MGCWGKGVEVIWCRTGRALIDVYGEEITLRVNDEAVTFNLNQTTRYSSTYDDLSVNQIDIIDVAREEYAQEILGFSNNSSGGNPTLTFEPILPDSSPSLTPFEGSDFILEEIDAYLKDESISLEINHADCDPYGDICLIENLLNNDPFQLPSMDLKQGEVVKEKSSIEEPPGPSWKSDLGRSSLGWKCNCYHVAFLEHTLCLYNKGIRLILPKICASYQSVCLGDRPIGFKRFTKWVLGQGHMGCWGKGVEVIWTGRALIDVYGEEITLRVNDEAVTFNLNQTTRYSSTYDDLSVNRIDIIDVAREEYAQEILGFSNNSSGGNPTLTFEPILPDSSPSLTSFEGSDFILEEIDAYLKDESISLEIDHADCDPDGDICLIENLLNNDPFQLPPMDLKQGEVVKEKSSIEEPSGLELKDLSSHLEYAYLEGADKLPVIISKDLKVDEKEALLKVLKSYKRAIA
nr:reverse transcriptase domain-containing protein [Tanacetum cinerariifolium]